MHVPNGERQELDPKSRKGLFVGYPEGTKRYKLYDLIRKKFVKSRDVLFMKESSIRQILKETWMKSLRLLFFLVIVYMKYQLILCQWEKQLKMIL